MNVTGTIHAGMARGMRNGVDNYKLDGKIAEAVVEGYKKIEDGVVGGYKKIEQGAVDGFTKVTDKCIEKMFAKEGETVEEAKKRLSGENHNAQ